MLIYVLACSAVLQLTAAVMAFRLIRLTGRRTAWSLIAVALVLMSIRRIIPLYRLLSGDMAFAPDLLNELIGLALSALMVLGVAGITPLFSAIKRSQMALRESEERYRATMMSVGDGVITTDTEGRVELLNPIAEALTGWQQEQARGKPLEQVFRIINEDTRQAAENPARQVMRDGCVVGLANHTVLVASDGTERLIADSGAPIRDDSGVVTGVVLVFRDQTQERAAQRELRESEIFLKSIFEQSPHAMWVSDSQGTLIRLNQACRDLLRVTDDDVIGKYNVLRDTIVEEQGYMPLVKRVFENGEATRFILVYDSKQLKTLDLKEFAFLILDVTISPVLDVFGRVHHAIIQHIDVTEHKRAEEALIASEIRYRRLFESAKDGILILDAETGMVLDVNPFLIEMLGYSHEQFLGKTVWELSFSRHRG